MFAAAIIVFRESLEAALIISVMAAATRGIPSRSQWIGFGVLTGLVGAALVASSMGAISNLASGIGQELFHTGILILAVGMLAWHNVWMAVHGRAMAEKIRGTARAVTDGTRERSVIFLVVALAVLREGSETVLFLYSLANGSADGMRVTIFGGLSGLAAGAVIAHSRSMVFFYDWRSCIAAGRQHGVTGSTQPHSGRFIAQFGRTIVGYLGRTVPVVCHGNVAPWFDWL